MIRFVYALKFQGWTRAPDQLAWELLLDEARSTGLRYDQLVHYPHEGGSIVLSLLALLLTPLVRSAGLPSLVLAALLFDTAARAAAIAVARRVFGGGAALTYALFSVFSLPLLLPWSVLGFGLHAASGIWPIVFLLFTHVGLGTRRRAALFGAFVALAIVFSYEDLALVPAALVLVVLEARGARGAAGRRVMLGFAASCAGLLSLHLLVRVTVPTGFLLQPHGPLSVRGLDFLSPPLGDLLSLWRRVFSHTLPGATQLPALAGLGKESLRVGFVLVAAGGVLLAILRRETRRAAALGALVLVTWLLLYAASPLFGPRRDFDDFIYYRHLAFILPLLSLLALAGFSARRHALRLGALVLIATSIAAGVNALRDVKASVPNDTSTGWVLAHKLGHDPDRLIRLLEVGGPRRRDLVFGYGWGYAAALFETADATSPAGLAGVERVRRVAALVPVELRGAFGEGIRFAFGPGITPRLDPRVLELILRALPAEVHAAG
ncbi:MAG: hypothetical protein ABIT01_08850 [Thermoanaerobaculia bacterium]